MRILVLGGDGMLGHQLLRSWAASHEVRVTLRQDPAAYVHHGMFDAANASFGVDVRSSDALLGIVSEFRPQAIINCVGVVKQRAAAEQHLPSLEINALLPHRLALVAGACGARLVHLSTDCVFSGRRGGYLESDPTDAEDLYGRSKMLGEVDEPHCITLRTSIVGREIARRTGLIEWFLSQKGQVRGFRRAIFSGFTTIEMARIIERVLVSYPEMHGVWHVSSDPIDKHRLLVLLNRRYGLATRIEPDDAFVCDRSLDSARFRAHCGYQPPSWEQMVEELR